MDTKQFREIDALNEETRRILRELAELRARSAATMARLKRLEVEVRELDEKRGQSVVDLRGLGLILHHLNSSPNKEEQKQQERNDETKDDKPRLRHLGVRVSC